MPYENFYKFNEGQYGEGVLLEEYNERLSLVAANESNKDGGTVYKKWCYPQAKGQRPGDTAIPMKVGGISRYEMVKMLKHFLAIIEP